MAGRDQEAAGEIRELCWPSNSVCRQLLFALKYCLPSATVRPKLLFAFKLLFALISVRPTQLCSPDSTLFALLNSVRLTQLTPSSRLLQELMSDDVDGDYSVGGRGGGRQIVSLRKAAGELCREHPSSGKNHLFLLLLLSVCPQPLFALN